MARVRKLPVCLLRGDARERGHRHGQLFQSRIAELIGRWRAGHDSATLATATERAQDSWRLLGFTAPEIKAEVEGIADGARCDPMDVYLRIGFEFVLPPGPAGCTATAMASASGALVGQNWDAPPSEAADLALFIHMEPDGRSTAVVAAIGALGWVGLNSAGLGLVSTDLILRGWAPGLPSQVVRRLALSLDTVEAAIGLLEHVPHMAGRAYLLGDAEGRVASIEVAPQLGTRVLPANRRLFHTNHALHPEISNLEDEGELRRVYPTTWYRRRRILLGGREAGSVDEIVRALSDRRGAPDSVSKSPSPREPTETAFSVVFDCAASRLHLCAGPPSEGRFISISLTRLAGARARSGQGRNLPVT